MNVLICDYLSVCAMNPPVLYTGNISHTHPLAYTTFFKYNALEEIVISPTRYYISFMPSHEFGIYRTIDYLFIAMPGVIDKDNPIKVWFLVVELFYFINPIICFIHCFGNLNFKKFE